MNYLAHIYLSRDQEMHSLGNFMADHIKGNSYLTYPVDIQKGILLHRQIDSFTDAHEVVRKSKRRLQEGYGLYRGIIIDIFYDHFLAANWDLFSDQPLDEFIQNFYRLLQTHRDLLPEKVGHISRYLIRDNWLLSYAEVEGILRVLEGMNRRTGELSQMNRAIHDLEEHYDDFFEDFKLFFRDLCLFSDAKMKEINMQYEE
jgi:acyl carrier protein phosphodiesterase